MPRGYWCGLETLGPDEVSGPPSIRARGHDVIDAAYSKLTPRLVRKANGNVVTLPGHVLLKAGDVVVDPTGIDEPVDTGYGTTTKREHLQQDIERHAHEVKPYTRRTGRLKWIEGEGYSPEVVDDSKVATPHGLRTVDALVPR